MVEELAYQIKLCNEKLFHLIQKGNNKEAEELLKLQIKYYEDLKVQIEDENKRN